MTLQQEAPPVVRERVPARARKGPNRTWRLLQKTHRWASLLTGIVLLLIVLSGAVLVLGPEIDEWTHPDLYRGTTSENPLSPAQAVAVVNRELPDFGPTDVIRTRGVYEIYDTEYTNDRARRSRQRRAAGPAQLDRRRDGLHPQPAPVRARLRGLPGLPAVPRRPRPDVRQRGADDRRPDPRRHRAAPAVPVHQRDRAVVARHPALRARLQGAPAQGHVRVQLRPAQRDRRSPCFRCC